MGLKSRNKGKSGEREIAGLVQELTGFTVKRRVRQHEGDSDLEGLPGWSIEVKRYARATRAEIRAWWEQAMRQAQATGLLPVLFYRLDRDEWRAVWRLNTGFGIADSWQGYEWTIEGRPEAWATVFRETIKDHSDD